MKGMSGVVNGLHDWKKSGAGAEPVRCKRCGVSYASAAGSEPCNPPTAIGHRITNRYRITNHYKAVGFVVGFAVGAVILATTGIRFFPPLLLGIIGYFVGRYFDRRREVEENAQEAADAAYYDARRREQDDGVERD
jgi:uncharacterized membrane protein